MPSTSAAVSPVSRSTWTHASSASDAALTSPPSREKPVVAAFAMATRSLAGLRPEITRRLRSRAGTTGTGTPSRSIQSSVTGVPMTMSSFAAPTTVLVKRSPGCSSSSTVTTGYGVA